MPKSLADGRKKVVMLSAPLTDPNDPTTWETEIQAGQDISCHILSSDFTLGPVDSETVSEKPLCVQGNVAVLGEQNTEGQMTVFRFFDETTDQPDPVEDFLFDAVKVAGSELYLIVRHSAKLSGEDVAAGDEVSYFEVITDVPKQSPMDGYIKHPTKLLPQRWSLYQVVGAAASGPVAITGATAGQPGSFAPASATIPADLAALKADPVIGDSAWSTATTAAWATSGDYVTLGDGSKAYWDGSNWVTGAVA